LTLARKMKRKLEDVILDLYQTRLKKFINSLKIQKITYMASLSKEKKTKAKMILKKILALYQTSFILTILLIAFSISIDFILLVCISTIIFF